MINNYISWFSFANAQVSTIITILQLGSCKINLKSRIGKQLVSTLTYHSGGINKMFAINSSNTSLNSSDLSALSYNLLNFTLFIDLHT